MTEDGEGFRVPRVPDEDHGEGTNLRYGKTAPPPDAMISKFPSPEEIHIVVAGGTAGRFSVGCRSVGMPRPSSTTVTLESWWITTEISRQ